MGGSFPYRSRDELRAAIADNRLDIELREGAGRLAAPLRVGDRTAKNRLVVPMVGSHLAGGTRKLKP